MKTLLTVSLLTLTFVTITEAHAYIENDINASNNGGTTRVTVNNQVNTGNSNTSVKGTTTTRVNIDQSGGGTSSVTVNGKEYKVEGTGSLNINETDNSNGSATPSPNLTAAPSTESATLTPTAAPQMEQGNFKGLMEKIFESMRNFFARIF